MDEILQDHEVQVIQKETMPLQEKINALDVIDEPSSKFATDLLAFITKAKRRLEDRRVFFTKPLNEHIKSINNYFKSFGDPLDVMDRQIKGKLLGYRQMMQEQERKKQDEIKKFAEENNLPAVKAEPEISNAVRSSIGSSFAVKRWTWAVEDETKIPREYLIIDEKKINAMIRAQAKTVKGVSTCDLKIEGVKIYQEESISVRA